jgi:F-type H+-transporting ATPase subunit b
MTRRLIVAGIAIAAGVMFSTTTAAALAQEPPAEKAAEKAGEPANHGEHGSMEIWKWANFAVLAGVLGYMVAKNAGPFFVARSRQIRKDMLEADELRKQAEARAAEVDRRLAGLEAEIAQLRADSQRETQAESERLSKYVLAEIAKVQAHAQQEIASAGKAARQELKRYSAKLAVGLAEQKIRARMGGTTQDVLIHNFVRKLEPPAAARTS